MRGDRASAIRPNMGWATQPLQKIWAQPTNTSERISSLSSLFVPSPTLPPLLLMSNPSIETQHANQCTAVSMIPFFLFHFEKCVGHNDEGTTQHPKFGPFLLAHLSSCLSRMKNQQQFMGKA